MCYRIALTLRYNCYINTSYIYSGVRVKRIFNASSKLISHMLVAFKCISAIILCMQSFTISAAEPISSKVSEDALVTEGLNNKDTKEVKEPRYGVGSGFLSDGVETGFSSEDGVITQTDFSKETGFSRENRGIQQPGFSNLILMNSSVIRDSNPSQVSSRKTPVWIYSITPQVLLNYNTELSRLYFNAALDVQRHSNENVLADREDPRLSIGWEQKYDSGNLGLNANFSQTSSRGQELRATGVFQNSNFVKTKAINKSLSGTWEHALAQRWTILTDGLLEKNTFSDVQGLNGTTLVNIRSKLTYANNEKLNTYVQLGYSELRPDAAIEDSRIARLAFGADYQITEAFNVSSRANVYRLSGLQSDTGLEGGIKLEYNLERMNFNAELSHGLADTAVGNFQKTDTLGLGWVFSMSSLDTLGASYVLSRIKGDGVLGKFEFSETRAFFERVLSGSWRGQASASFREQETQGTYINGNIVGISLTYSGLSF